MIKNNTEIKICKSNKLKYFNQICTEEVLDLPCNHPDIAQIISNIVDCEIISKRLVETIKGISYEGQYLSGKLLVIDIKIHQKILYVAEKNTQDVHIFENISFRSTYIVIPYLIEGTDPEYLINNKMLNCKLVVDTIFTKNVGKRKIIKSLCLLVSADLSPTYEICCLANYCKYSDILIMHNDGTHSMNLSTTEKKKCYKPIWSPMGREIAFISDNNSNKMLNVHSIKSDSNIKLNETSIFRSIGSYCWSADGSKLIFSGLKSNCKEIYSINTNNSCLTQLTFGDEIYNSFLPKCSPCGKKIAFLRSVSESYSTEIWFMSSASMDYYKLTSCGSVKHFDWSPDSTEIIYVSQENEKKDKIYVINIDSKYNEEVCVDIVYPIKKKVKFSPDGTKFAFIASLLDSEEIYVYDFINKEVENITKNNENVKVSDFIWSTDSDSIYYADNSLFYYNVYDFSLSEHCKSQITNTTASKIELSYRPRII